MLGSENFEDLLALKLELIIVSAAVSIVPYFLCKSSIARSRSFIFCMAFVIVLRAAYTRGTR